MMIPNKPKCKKSNQWIIGQNDNTDKGQVIYGSIREVRSKLGNEQA